MNLVFIFETSGGDNLQQQQQGKGTTKPPQIYPLMYVSEKHRETSQHKQPGSSRT